MAFFPVLFSSCTRDEEPVPSDLERLAFVRPGECLFWPGITCSNPRALLVDRFEVTRATWRAWYEGRETRRDPVCEPFLAAWTPETADWPASFMTLVEARDFAAARGMRLPTAREWMRIACGRNERPYDYPWGGSKAVSVANTLELELRNPLPVGTFEQGRTPLSIYDMAGNVWEWVEDPIQPVSSKMSPLAWAMGGSYLSRLRRLYDYSEGRLAFYEQELDPSARSVDVGLRCCADAEEYLWKNADRWRGDRERERLLAVGATWGRDAIPVLEELAKRAGAPDSLAILLAGARQ